MSIPPPKISIVTPSFNQGSFIRATIESVLEQEYPNLEYIVIDGGSTDGSVDVIREYADRLAYWTSEPDRGQSHAINKGLARATGDILGWLNSDDRLEQGCLHSVAARALECPDCGVFVGHGRIVTLAGKVIYYREPGDLTREGMFGWLGGGDFMQPSTFFRRAVWEQAGPLDEELHIALDVDLWLRMANVAKFAKIDRLLSTALAHEQAKTTALVNRMIVDCSLVIARAGGEKSVRPHLEKLADRLTECERQLAEYERKYRKPAPLKGWRGLIPFYRPMARFAKRVLRVQPALN